MRIIRIVDKLLLLTMSLLMLFNSFIWSLESINYIYIFFFFVRWIVIPVARRIQKNSHGNRK